MDRKKGDVKYRTTQTGETGKAELFRVYLAECRGPFGLFLLFCCIFAVSYTHLDVYKRQHLTRETFSGRRPVDGADTPGGVFRPGEYLALGRRGR